MTTPSTYTTSWDRTPADALRAICRTVGVSADWILFGGLMLNRDAFVDAVASYQEIAALGTKMTADQAALMILQVYEKEFLRQFADRRMIEQTLYVDDPSKTEGEHGLFARSIWQED
jgi:hypothetical protein